MEGEVGEAGSGEEEGEAGGERADDSEPGCSSSCTCLMRRLVWLMNSLFFTAVYWYGQCLHALPQHFRLLRALEVKTL